jgi:hypothetical protein
LPARSHSWWSTAADASPRRLALLHHGRQRPPGCHNIRRPRTRRARPRSPLTRSHALADIDSPSLSRDGPDHRQLRDRRGCSLVRGHRRISASWNPGTGTLTLTGTALLADYQTALRPSCTSTRRTRPSRLVRTVTFTISDAVASSTPASRQMSVGAVNDPPAVAATPGSALR